MVNKKDEVEIDEILNETDSLKQSMALNKIVLKLLKQNRQENFRLWLIILFLLLFSMFSIVFLELNHAKQQENFVREQERYLEFLKEFDYEVEIVEEVIEDEEGIETIDINQENNEGNNIVQTGNNATYNQ